MHSFGSLCFLMVLVAWIPLEDLAAEIVINEIMYHPSHADQTPEPREEEFIELHNADLSNSVDLAGWSFNSGITFTFPSVFIPAGGFVVVAADPVAFAAKYPGVTATVVGPFIGRLSNSSERIRLIDSLGEVVDSLTYSHDGDWAKRREGPLDQGHTGWIWESPADGGGFSLELVNPAISNKRGQNWLDSLTPGGSPGAVNSVVATDVAPFIDKVSHSPLIPTSSELVLVRAELTDEQTAIALSATVYYRISSMSPGSFTALAMSDDGLSGDDLHGDGIFAATLPAHADGAVIEFYIESSDGTNSRTWPAATDALGAQQANALYAVEDAQVTDSREVYRIVLSVPEDNEFSFGTFDPLSNAQMNATFIVTRGNDREVRYRAGLRRRGNGSRLEAPRTFRLNLPDDEPWDQVVSLNLNADHSYLQIFGHKLFAAACLPGGSGRSVKLFINGGDQASGTIRDHGYYAHMEPQGSLSVKRQFPDDDAGNLYSKRSPSADLAYYNGDLTIYPTDGWGKQTNTSDWDWADVDALMGAINDSANPNYITNLEAQMDIEQWMRWFAVMALIGNGEASISNGKDDDYYIYRGTLDPRFKIIPHDLDSILGFGGNFRRSLFDMFEDGQKIEILEDLFTHPEVLPRYYHHLRELSYTVLSKENFDALAHECLDFIPPAEVTAIIDFMDDRRAFVLDIVDAPFVATSSLPQSGGYYYTTADSLNLSGTFSSSTIASVTVNGVAAALNVREGTWSFGSAGGMLNPGVNRITIQALDAETNEVLREILEIWYDDGTTQGLSGSLLADTTLTASGGPYLVTSDLTVPAGVTLTVEPGTSVFFSGGTRLTVEGTLVAEGTFYEPIYFTQNPAAPVAWEGVYFASSGTDNRMIHLEQSHASAGGQSVDITNSQVSLEQVRWSGTTGTILSVGNPQLTVTGCEFPSSVGQHIIQGSGLSGANYFHLDGCNFQPSSGEYDIVNFSGGRRPGPILNVTNNFFDGATDDCLDLDGADAHIEGNVFQGIHSDDPLRPNTSSAIVGDSSAHLTIVRNTFNDVDQALLLLNDADAVFENNVVTGASLGVISFNEPLRTVDAGSGVTVRSNIFSGNTVSFLHPGHLDGSGSTPAIIAELNILPVVDHSYGSGNLDVDPGWIDLSNGDFGLLPGSWARSSGINGSDMGQDIPSGALLTGAPPALTGSDSATLLVHIAGVSSLESGSFISEYRWRINGGPWSPDTPTSMPIVLTGLADGLQEVEAVAKNSAGIWQADAAAAMVSWMVDSTRSALRINEVLARNEGSFDNAGTFPDYVELHNTGSVPIVLTGMSLTDDLTIPNKYTFPTMSLNGGEYLLLIADSEFSLPGIHLGFSLRAGGESVRLFAADGTTEIDSITFGPQIADCSIGRLGSSATWGLNLPTPGIANVGKGTGSPDSLHLNEWLAGSLLMFCDDFAELYNAGSEAVDLGGLYFTDDPGVAKTMHQIPPLSYIDAGGFQAFWASGEPERGGDHLGFRLNANAEWIGLYDSSLSPVDLVPFDGESTDVSAGLSPDGGTSVTTFLLPTPGISNTPGGLANVQNLIAGLRITEIMYDPDDGGDYEFIEFQNVGTVTLELAGVRLSDGVEFEFPAWSLGPGEFVLIVKNIAAFESKYGSGLPVAGAYALSLSNAGEELVLQLPEPFEANIQKFTYDDAWFPLTDGGGYSLEIVDPTVSVADWNSPAAWRIGELQGTPGGDVSLSAGVDQLVKLPGSASLVGNVGGSWSPTYLWSKTSGPGSVSFSSGASLSSDATFSLPGTYVLRLTGEDGPLMLTSEVEVTVDDVYAAWKARLGVVGGPFDNDDGDSHLNIEEYAHEMDPLTVEPPFSPPYTISGEEIVFDLTLYPRKSDLEVVLQSSLDATPASWFATTPVFVSGTPDQQLLQLRQDRNSIPESYFRYVVTLQP